MTLDSPPCTSAAGSMADIDRSPTILLSSLFAAHRSGDAVLERFYLRRLRTLGIYITFGTVPGKKTLRRKGVRA